MFLRLFYEWLYYCFVLGAPVAIIVGIVWAYNREEDRNGW